MDPLNPKPPIPGPVSCCTGPHGANTGDNQSALDDPCQHLRELYEAIVALASGQAIATVKSGSAVSSRERSFQAGNISELRKLYRGAWNYAKSQGLSCGQLPSPDEVDGKQRLGRPAVARC